MFESATSGQELVWENRTELLSSIGLLILAGSLILLTVSLLLQKNLLSTLFVNTFKNYSFNVPLNTGSSLMLIANYLLVFIGIVFMFMRDYTNFVQGKEMFVYALLLMVLIVPFVNLILTFFFIGRQEIVVEMLQLSKNLIIFKSIFLSVFLLLWVFNYQWNIYFKLLIIGIFMLFYVVRIMLSLGKSFKHSVHWYYLILYFCAFEILPYAFLGVFLGRFLGIEIIV
jgi:hypothetical protein